MIWIIQSDCERDDETGEALFWNNELGWVDHSTATYFTQEEKELYHYLPISGRWTKFN